jgi:hypothetical protein
MQDTRARLLFGGDESAPRRKHRLVLAYQMDHSSFATPPQAGMGACVTLLPTFCLRALVGLLARFP